MKKNIWLKTSMLTSSAILSLQLAAAPGTLLDLPLDVSREVQPNILILLDDSGSMGWSQLISIEGQVFGTGANGRGNDNFQMPPVDQIDFNEKCVRYNLLAYDPSVRYEPWSGTDIADTLYEDLNLSLMASRNDPYRTATINISGHIYTSFVDGSNGGANTDPDVLNANECGVFTDFLVANDATTRLGTVASSNDAVGVLTDSGGFVGRYRDNENLSFIIAPSGATDLQLTFTQFSTEDNFDTLTVTQLSNDGLTDLTTDTFDDNTLPDDGNGTPGQFLFNTGRARIDFTSDGSVVQDGFSLFWTHTGTALPAPVPLAVADTIDETACRASANCNLVQDLPLASADPSEVNTQENYANWYSYYRTRELVAKKALSGIVNESDNRLGLGTLNNNDNVGTLVKNMNVSANKTELFTNLFEVRSASGTPLRLALNNAGLYFDEDEEVPPALFGAAANHTGDGTVSVESPILNQAGGGICQQNFSVLFSDGEWNGGDPGVGDTDVDGALAWDGATFADTFGPSATTNRSNTLADVAMRYLEEDLSDTLSNNNTVRDIHHIEEPPVDRRIIPHQHMTTYTVAFGLTGTLDGNPGGPDQVPTVMPAPTYVFPGWTTPVQNTVTTIDDMRHAAWNGRGEFLSAANPEELITTLNATIDSIGDRTNATSAGASFNSTIISTDTLVFRGSFITNDWTGDLQAFQFDDDGIIDRGTTGDASDDAVWSANEKLATQVNADFSSRNIVTFNGSRAVAFDFPDLTLAEPFSDSPTPLNSALTSVQAARLLEDYDVGAPTATAEERRDFGTLLVNYLKGDNDNEGTLFRERFDNYLGPIINSSPQFVGVPNEPYPDLLARTDFSSATPTATDAIRYSVFRQAQISRTPLVYVGGNDGMLHAFTAGGVILDAGGVEIGVSGGDEIFAYIPSFLENNIQDFSQNSYAHQAYVDGTPTVRDVYVDADGAGAGTEEWRTYLVSATRSGGRGIFVLDVTDPAELASAATVARASGSATLNSPVKFEYTSADDPDLGFVYGRPQIARMNNDKWVAIVPNGYNSTGDGEAHLFVIDLETGTLLKKISTGVGSRATGLPCTDGASNCNGLSSPTIADLDGDFIVDRIYAGDLHGNMWVFDVSSDDIADWDVAFDDGGTKNPLFTACANAGACSPSLTDNRQPITVAPEIIFHPTQTSPDGEPNILVYFGTGQFIAVNDQVNDTTQSFYAIWDSGTAPAIVGDPERSGNLRRSNLQQQGLFSRDDGMGGTVIDVQGVNTDATFSPNARVEYDVAGEQGWFVNLELDVAGTNVIDRGRSIISPLVINEVVVFVITAPTGNICLPVGSSNIVGLDALNGSAPDFTVFTDPDTDGNGFFIRKDSSSIVGLGSIIDQDGDINIKIDENDAIDGIGTSLGGINTRGPVPLGRKSWSILR